jgi:hypothetical protein
MVIIDFTTTTNTNRHEYTPKHAKADNTRLSAAVFCRIK